MENDLEKIVGRRKKEAKDKNILGKANKVLEQLGKEKELEIYGDLYGHYEYSLIKKRLVLCNETTSLLDPYSSRTYTEIKYDNKLVFEGEHLCENRDNYYVHSYAPGPWEEELEKLYTKAIRKIAKKKEKEKEESKIQEEQEHKNFKEKWGIK